MYRNWRIERFACAAMLVASLRPATASAQAMKRRPTLTPALAATRAALDKYKDPMQAVRDGYFSTVACIFGQTLMGPMEGHQPIMPRDCTNGTCTSRSGKTIRTACSARRTPP